MDCESAVYRVSGEIARAFEAISEPTGWEVAGVLTSALAAASASFIAFANLVLLRRQHQLQKDEIEREQRLRRALFGQALRRRLLEVFVEAQGITSTLQEADRVSAHELDRLGIETGEKSASDFQLYITTRMDLRTKGEGANPELIDLTLELEETIANWIDNPSSEILTFRDAIAKENARDSGAPGATG